MTNPGGPHPCGADSVTVHGYYRAGRRKKHRPAKWWECRRAGRWCGIRHASQAASYAHSRKLDKIVRKAHAGGKLTLWEPEERH
jgi:hypothetical protein